MSIDLGAFPRWVFAFAALVIAVSAGYGMFFADCTTELFGLSFGKSRPCVRSDVELVSRMDTLEKDIAALGQRDRGAQELTITNQGGGDKNGCPVGWFVSAISAPGGVGGKFATDGINKISYKCSPIVSR
jgi:hypothetical protein